ncbi:MAG: SDR family oxidoreductase [Acidimicrobiia bacterium]|nr:MAG: SDR family oxidoreductase [Acidimicrobiia bacterium]
MDVKGRVAVVTGGGVRVGKALALGLAAAGADVFIHYGRSAGPAADTASDAEALGVRAAVGSVDLSVPQDAARVIDLAEEALGPVSLLVNSASGFSEDTIEDVGFETWQQTLDLTLSAPVFLTKAFADRLPSLMSGAVVNVTDVRTTTPNLKHFSYIVAKGGIDAFTRAAAVGLAPRIRVNAVALGLVLPQQDDRYAQRLATTLPLAGVGGTGTVVDTVLFLLSNDFVTGEIVRVDGGGHLT